MSALRLLWRWSTNGILTLPLLSSSPPLSFNFAFRRQDRVAEPLPPDHAGPRGQGHVSEGPCHRWFFFCFARGENTLRES